VALVGTLGACNLSAETVAQPDETADQAHWAMPLDEYSMQPVDSVRYSYAANLLETPCFSQGGFDVPDPWFDIDVIVSRANVNAMGRLLLSPESASKWGYQKAPQESDLSQIEARDSVIGQMRNDTPGFGEVFDRCVEETYDTFGEQWVGAENYALGLASNASADAREDPSVVEAAQSWRECMANVGAGVLAAFPLDMPTQSMVDSWGSDAEGVPSASEISVAMSDAQCRESSGFTDALYGAEWQAQQKYLNENRETLEAGREVLQEWSSKVDTIIGSHVGQNQ